MSGADPQDGARAGNGAAGDSPQLEATSGGAPSAGEDFQHFRRPTGALELFDRVFLVWRLRPWRFLGLGALASAAPFALDLALACGLIRFSAEQLNRSMPWMFAAFLVQAFAAVMLLRAAFAAYVARGMDSRGAPALWHAYPRVVVAVLFLVFGASLLLAMGELAALAMGPTLLALVAMVAAVGLALFFTASFVLAPPIIAISGETIYQALAMSWRLMRFTRFGASWWRDNAYWRLALLASFPLVARLTVDGGLRVAWWVAGGEWPMWTAEPSGLAVVLAVGVALADAFIVPWMCIALVCLLAELLARYAGYDLAIHLRMTSAVDSPRHAE
jgi:hypothetical protein